MLNFLEGFHHRVARWITGMTETHGTGTGEYGSNSAVPDDDI